MNYTKKLISRSLAAIACTSMLAAQAAEVDSFTRRTDNLKNLSDSTMALERIINYYIDLGIEKANLKDKTSCSDNLGDKRADLIQYVRKFVGGHWRIQNGLSFSGNVNMYRVVKYPEKYPDLLKKMKVKLVQNIEEANQVKAEGEYAPLMITYVKVPESIYRNVPKLDAPSVGLVSLFHDTTASILRVGEGKDAYILGSDKFTHFFNRGRKYYAYFYGEKDDSEDIESQALREQFATETGTFSELSLFGSKSTGVSSFGDLAANFQGMRFWNDFTARGKDVVTQKVNKAFVTCVGNQWVRTDRKFKLSDYANVGWDEAYNCSYYKNQFIIDTIKNEIDNLPNPKDRKHCSIDILRSLKLTEIYGRFFDETINVTPYQITPQEGNGFLTMIFTGTSGAPSAEEYQMQTDGSVYQCHKTILTNKGPYNVINDGITVAEATSNTAALCTSVTKTLRDQELIPNSPDNTIESYCSIMDKCEIAVKYKN